MISLIKIQNGCISKPFNELHILDLIAGRWEVLFLVLLGQKRKAFHLLKSSKEMHTCILTPGGQILLLDSSVLIGRNSTQVFSLVEV